MAQQLQLTEKQMAQLRANQGKPIGQPVAEAAPVLDALDLSVLREEEISKEGWLYDPMMGARAVLDGYFWGWSDEIAASVAAGAWQMFGGGMTPDAGAELTPEMEERARSLGLDTGEMPEQSYLDVRREMMAGLEAEREEWTENNLGKTIGLNLAGALGSGKFVVDAVKTGTGLLTSGGANVLGRVKPVQNVVASRQQAKVANTLNKMESVNPSVAAGVNVAARQPVAQTAVTAANKSQTLTGKMAQTARKDGATLLGVGGIAGMGYASDDEDLIPAFMKGATLNFGIGVPFTALSNMILNGATRSRIAQDLGRARDFIPIGYATLKDSASRWERGLNIFYNQIVSKTFSSNSLLAQQQKRFSLMADEQLVKINNGLKQTTEDVQSAILNAKNKLQFKADAKQLDKTQNEKLNAAERKVLDDEVVANLKLNATANADAAQNAAEASFRVTAMKNSIPEGAPKGTAERLAGIPDMHLRLKELNNLWQQHGYSMLKNRSFRIDTSAMSAQIQSKLGGVPELVTALTGSGKSSNAAQLVDDFLAAHVGKGGWVKGADLNQLRTRIAQAANDLSDEGSSAATKQILRQIVTTLDDTVLKQLPKDKQAAFALQQEQWLTNLVFRDAVQGSIKKQGNFSLDEWLGAGKKVNVFRAGEGRIPLQSEAGVLRATGAERDSLIKRGAEEVVKQERIAAAKQAQKRVNEIEKENLAIKEQVKKAKQDADAKGVQQLERALEEGQRKKSALMETINAWGKVESSPDLSIFHQWASSKILGFGSAVVGTTATAPGLTTQTAQRVLVGQTAPQRAIQTALQADDNFISQGVRTATAGREVIDSAPSDMIQSANTLSELPEIGKVKAYMNLRRTGRLEALQTQNPKVYKELTEAFYRSQKQ